MPAAGEDLGGGARELRREEPRVVADDDAARGRPGPASREVEAGGRRGDAADLGERAVVGDDAAPAVGAEGDRQRASARAGGRGTPRAGSRRSPALEELRGAGEAEARAPEAVEEDGDLARRPVRRGRCRGAAARCRRSRRAHEPLEKALGRLVRARARVRDPVEAVEARPARPSSRRASSRARPPSGGSRRCARRRARARAAPSCGRSPRGRAAPCARARPARNARSTPEPRDLAAVRGVRRQVRVRVGVVADLVAVGRDAARDVGVAADELAGQEDRRVDSARGQGVEDRDRRRDPRSRRRRRRGRRAGRRARASGPAAPGPREGPAGAAAARGPARDVGRAVGRGCGRRSLRQSADGGAAGDGCGEPGVGSRRVGERRTTAAWRRRGTGPSRGPRRTGSGRPRPARSRRTGRRRRGRPPCRRRRCPPGAGRSRRRLTDLEARRRRFSRAAGRAAEGLLSRSSSRTVRRARTTGAAAASATTATASARPGTGVASAPWTRRQTACRPASRAQRVEQ